MKKIIWAAVLAFLSAAAPVRADKPQEFDHKETAVGFVKQVHEVDLYGVWVMMVEDGETVILNHTIIRPDRTAHDFMCITNLDSRERIYISQDITWTFDAAAQTVTEKVTARHVRKNGGNAQSDASKTGTIQTAKVRVKKVNGKPFLLEWRQVGGTDMVYVKAPDDMALRVKEFENRCAGGL